MISGRTNAWLAVVAPLARRLPFFYGWVIVYVSFMALIFSGATSFWGMQVFVGPMSEDTGWAKSYILAGLSLRFIVGGVSGFVLGRVADRNGGAAMLLFAGVLVDATAMAALRWVDSPAHFLLLYGVVGGIGSTGLRIVQAALLPKWFVARRGSAVGIAMLGGGVSALLMTPVIAVLVTSLGWRDAWVVLALIYAVALVPCAPLLVRSPEDIGLQPDNGEVRPMPGRVAAATERSYSLGEVTATWRFWLLVIGMIIGSQSLLTNTVILVPYFEERGFSPGVAASAISVWGLASIFSRFLWGFAAERLTARRAIVVQALLSVANVALLFSISGSGTLYIAAAMQGVVMSGFPTLSQLLWPEYFGRRHIGSIIGVTQMFMTIANASGPLIVGLLFDATGTYETALYVMAVTWLICAAVVFSVRPAREAETAATTG